MPQVKFYRGTAEDFANLQDPDPDGLYIIGGEDGSGESEPQDD